MNAEAPIPFPQSDRLADEVTVSGTPNMAGDTDDELVSFKL